MANRIPFQGKGAKTLKPHDLFDTLRPRDRAQTLGGMKGAAVAIVAGMGGRVITAAELRRQQAEQAKRA